MRAMDALPRLPEIRALCEKHRVKSLHVFGSVAKGTFDERTSDIDFVVEFLPDAPRNGFGGAYFSLLADLSDLLGREVDLVERPAIKNPYFRQVLDLTQRVIYESDRAA